MTSVTRRLFLALSIVLSAVTTAPALDLGASISDVEGKPIVQDGVEMTIGKLIVVALLTPFPDEQNLGGEEKQKRFAIAMKVQGRIGSGEDPGLSIDELATVKRLVGKAFTPLVVGRVWDLLEKK